DEMEVRPGIALAGGVHGAAGNVDPHTARGPQGGQQMARAAADVQDSLAGRDACLQGAGQVTVEIALRLSGLLDGLVVVLVEGRDLFQDRVRQWLGAAALLWRYHSMVLFRPSSNPVVARKPNSRSALEVSRERRGWPSGLAGSKRICPRKPIRRAISST